MEGGLVQIFAYLVALPVSLVLATPVMLVAAFFGAERYAKNVKRYDRRVIEWWGEALRYMG